MRSLSEGKNFSITVDCPLSRIPGEFRVLPFGKIIKKILGKNYFVSIAFVRESKMRILNKEYRNKNESTDILSFNLNENSGEILFSINNVRRKAKVSKMTAGEYLPYLLIHGLLHLKGLKHGKQMAKKEKIYLKKYFKK